jgi:hypothetical protein
MTTSDAIARITAIRETLMEARRYVVSDSQTAVGMIEEAAFSLNDWYDDDEHMTDEQDFMGSRLLGNIIVAQKYMQVDPEMASGYLYGAVFELGVLRSELEKSIEQSEEGTMTLNVSDLPDHIRELL